MFTLMPVLWEDAGLLERTASGELMAPWDVIDAHVSLVA